MEPAQAKAIGSGALREQYDALAGAQRLGNPSVGILLALAARDEQGARAGGKPANQGPAAHFRLGQKADAFQLAAEYRNVEPGYVVTRIKRAGYGLAMAHQFDAQRPACAGVPRADGACATRGERVAVKGCLDQAEQKMHGQSEQFKPPRERTGWSHSGWGPGAGRSGDDSAPAGARHRAG